MIIETKKGINYTLRFNYEDFLFFNGLVSKELEKGNTKANFKFVFLKALKLIQTANPNISLLKDNLPIRRKSTNSNKITFTIKRTSLNLTSLEINWINSFIQEKINLGFKGYCQIDFVKEMCLYLKKNVLD